MTFRPFTWKRYSRHAAPLAFTMVELLIVVAVIGALMGIALPLFGIIKEGARRQSTIQVLASVAAAITTSSKGTTVQLSTGAVRRLWDFNGDKILDGAPDRDTSFSTSDRSAASAAAYTGPVDMLGVAIPRQYVDAQAHILDGWGSPLRIEFSQDLYGKTGFGLWSCGRNKQDETGSGDDLSTWKQP